MTVIDHNKRSYKLANEGVLALTENGEVVTWMMFSSAKEKQRLSKEWVDLGICLGEEVCPRVTIEKMQTNKGEVIRESTDWVSLSYVMNHFAF